MMAQPKEKCDRTNHNNKIENKTESRRKKH